MVPYQKKIGTKTSAFGSPGRINHDSSSFYKSRLYEGLPKEEIKKYEENPIPVQFLDKIFTSSSEQMIELPLRTIKLYTFKGDVVLDPFMGSGQTAIAALKASCHYTGHDILKEYVALAGKRIKRYLQEQITLFSEPTDAESQIISEKPRRKGYQVKIKYN